MKNLLSASGIPPYRRKEGWLIEARGLSGLGMNSSFQSLSSRKEKTSPKGVDSKNLSYEAENQLEHPTHK